MGMVEDNDTGRPLWYRAIHRKVLVVYTEHTFDEDNGVWAAYVVPVQGLNHNREAQTWRTEGTKMAESEARALYGAVTEDFDERGLKYNP
jgi:sugar-specific transcriptional regulator TrmB